MGFSLVVFGAICANAQPNPVAGHASAHNPDGLTEATTVIFSRDYETQAPSDINDNFRGRGGAMYEWGDAYGYAGTGGWRLQPSPIEGEIGDSEEIVGWAMPDARSFPVDRFELVVTSFMLKITRPLLDEIARGRSFWNHPNKVLDFRCWNPSGTGEGCRNGFHFGESPPQWFFSVGGGGQVRPGVGPDWRTLADEWVWVALVIDMRGTSDSDRRLAIYYASESDGVIKRAGEIRWDNGTNMPLVPYDGRGFHSYNYGNTLFGYWDDAVGRQELDGDLSDMHVYIDRIRVTDGWPIGADGPPIAWRTGR